MVQRQNNMFTPGHKQAQQMEFEGMEGRILNGMKEEWNEMEWKKEGTNGMEEQGMEWNGMEDGWTRTEDI